MPAWICSTRMRKNKSKQRGHVSSAARRSPEPHFTLLGFGAMNFGRYQPAGLLVEARHAGWPPWGDSSR